MDKQIVLDIATTLHAVFCPLNHEDDVLAVVNEDTGMCNWYVESQCENPWDRPAHNLWMLKAAILVKTLQKTGNGQEDIEDFVVATLEVCRKVLDLRMINEDAEKQLMQMLTDYHGGVL